MTTGILPINMRLSAESGKTTHGDFVVQPPLPNGRIVATLDGNTSVFHLREIVATEMIRERLTDEEFEQLPPALRNEAHRFSVRFEEFSRAGNGEPLAVRPGLHVRGVVDCTAPAGLPATHTATLRVDGLGDDAEMPITFVTAGVQVEFPKGPVIARQGQTVSLPVRVTLPGAPDTDLTLEISHGFAAIPPTPLHVPQDGSMTTILSLSTGPQTPLGSLESILTVKGHSQNFDFIPIEILVKPPVRPPQVNKAAVVAKIHDTYLRTGAHSGRLGFPTSEVAFTGNTAKRRYRGGEINARAEFDGEDQVGVVTQALAIPGVRITFVGFRCVAASNELSASDEPYFVISVINGSNQAVVQKFGPFEGVETGTEIGVGSTLISSAAPNPTAILAIAYENDEGDPDETARKLREKAAAVVQQVQSLIAADAASSADGPGVGTAAGASAVGSFISGPIGGLLAAGVVSLLGLADDYVGQNVALVLQRPDEVHTMPELGKFRGNSFNVHIRIDGRDEGHYELFFDMHVELHITTEI
jgi:hypothetical protein